MQPINTGDTAFVLVTAALVALMTPGLAFFYGGPGPRKNFLAIMMQSFISMGIVTAIWVTVGYSLAFSGDIGGIIGTSTGRSCEASARPRGRGRRRSRRRPTSSSRRCSRSSRRRSSRERSPTGSGSRAT